MNTDLPLAARLTEMAVLMSRFTSTDGMHATAIPRMWIIRSSRPNELMPAVYKPSLCVIAQGSKQVTLAGEKYLYDRSRYLVASVDLPMIGEVLEASASEPYLCLCLDLDLQDTAAVMLDMEVAPLADKPPARGLFLARATVDFIDAILRLLRLLKTPEDIAALAPLAEREIVYRLLKSPEGWRLRQVMAGQGHARRIAKSMEWIRKHFHEPLSIESLASAASMSSSSFHAHFKSVTSLSPLQYQKQLRLQEARRLLLSDALDAATAGHRVGYESPSQFNREYRRLFGVSPGKDVPKLRA
jgi:AraC-like DNA-binding protein